MKLAICVPTQSEIVIIMLSLAQINSEDIVYDLGCGDGRILISAIQDFGAQKAIGYEISADLCEAAKEEIQKSRLQHRIKIVQDDLLEASLYDCSVLTLYLSSEANELLRPKLQKQLKLGSRVISHSYPINSWKVANTVELKDLNFGTSKFADTLYLYRIPEAYESC
ncbi:class I SAM-dependent methyltransferase [Chloroflexota bacterium]